MSAPPWEAHNISSTNAGSRIDIFELLISPINRIPDLELILIIVSIVLIILGAVQIKNLYKNYIEEFKR